MECVYCNNKFSTKTNLNNHQKRAKYCLKLRGVNKQENEYEYKCDACDKNFSGKYELNRHSTICKKNDILINNNKIIQTLREELISVKKENELLRADKKDLQDRYDNLSLTAVKRPTVSNKNIQINNYIKNMPPLLEQDIKDNIQYLTLDHHVKGAEGYAEYALEFPFKNKIVCVDTARNKIKYKNEEGDIIEDVGFRKMMEKLCDALKDRSFNLCQEHYEKLSDTFTEKEVDDFNFMETAIAISKCANGKENDFCSKIIKMISKGVMIT
jgi:hypothetical protein